MQITLVFPPRDQGRVKAGWFPAPPAKKSSCYLCPNTVLSVIQGKAACHPAPRHRPHSPATNSTHPHIQRCLGAASETQELSGRPWADTDKGERPLLSQETSRKAELLLCQEPGPTMTGSHSLFLKTLDPKQGGYNFCCCANQTSGRGWGSVRDLIRLIWLHFIC